MLGGGMSRPLGIARRILGRPTCDAVSVCSTRTSTYRSRAAVYASVALAALWAAGCGGEEGGSGPVEPVPVNRPPAAVGTIPAQTLTVGETLPLDVASFFSDPDGDALTYAANTSSAAVATVSLSGTTLSIVGVAAGSATVTVTASDPGGLSTQQQAAVTVNAANRGPETVGTIPDQTVTAGETVPIDAAQYFRDPDGNPLTYAAATTDVAVAAVSMSGSTLTIAGVAPGSATVTVTATDPGGLSAELSASVTVERLNQGPEAVGTIPDQTITAGQTVPIDASLYFRDPDGDPLTYSAVTSNAAVAVPSVSGTTLTIAGVARGSAVVTVTATDAGGLTAMQDVDVNVGVRSRDREALVALYEATSGDFYWDIDTNWLSDRPIGTWYGVTTDDDGRVIELSLPNNTVWGPIPREIVHLQRLQRLDLSNNRVNGALPPEIGDLQELEELESQREYVPGLSDPDPGGPRQARQAAAVEPERHRLQRRDSQGARQPSEPGAAGVRGHDVAVGSDPARVRPAREPQASGRQRER